MLVQNLSQVEHDLHNLHARQWALMPRGWRDEVNLEKISISQDRNIQKKRSQTKKTFTDKYLNVANIH